ncbi:MAG: MFS transporter [Ktedonobacterales bacterium]
MDDSWPYLIAGSILLVAYSIWALRRRHPAVDLKLLRHSQSALAVMLSALAGIVMFAMLVLLPIYMQNLQGFSALTAGLALLPQGLVTGLGTVLGGIVAPRWGARRSTMIGMAILAFSTATLLLLTLDTPAWLTALLLCGRGLALGLTIQPLLNVMLGDLNAAETADGNTLFNVADRLGGSVGIALLATFFQQRERYHADQVLASLGIHLRGDGQNQTVAAIAHLPLAIRTQLALGALTGFHDTILLLVLLSLVGLALTMLLRDSPTTQPSWKDAATSDKQTTESTAVEATI